MSGLAPEVVLEGSRVFREFKGALTEQYVYQQLTAETDVELYYWSTEDSRTEIDFIFQSGMHVCPLEVKSEGNVRSQSLRSYEHRFHPIMVCRASMLPYIRQEVPLGNEASCVLFNIPLYAVSAAIEQQLDK